jgi:hypothetical protein
MDSAVRLIADDRSLITRFALTRAHPRNPWSSALPEIRVYLRLFVVTSPEKKLKIVIDLFCGNCDFSRSLAQETPLAPKTPVSQKNPVS